jgi:peptidyl-prolyl cis-trans isomerase B (cyclophilin B)
MAEVARLKRRSRNVRRSIITVVVAAAVVGIVYLLVGSSSPKAAVKPKTTTTTTSSTTTTTTAPTTTAPTTTTQAAVVPTCPPATAGGAPLRETNFKSAPKNCIVESDIYKATFETSIGDFVITMPASANPTAVNNFVFLARYHFFDDTTFFRVVPGFVIQGGSPDNTNEGSSQVSEAGYSWTGNVPPASCSAKKDCYPNYSIAMANGGAPSSNGSEFFIVLPGGGAELGDLYTLFGQVTSGQSVVNEIGADGSSAGIPPKVTIHVIKVTISQTPG